jgi:hypothetical protein
MRTLYVVFGMIVLASSMAIAQDVDQQRIDPLADYVLQQMASKLAAAEQVSFHLETSTDVLDEGLRVRMGRTANVALRRPDRLMMHARGDAGRLGFRYDGRTATLYHVDFELYSSVRAPGIIDELLGHLFKEYGFTFPMADLVLSNPYAALMEDVTQGKYVGLALVDGVQCHHLAFQSPGLDWQIWVEDSMWQYPRQYTLAFTDLPGCPQFTAKMSKFDYGAELSDELFEFDPPSVARQIRFRKVNE